MGMTTERAKFEMDADSFEDFVQNREARREMEAD
jgi:hypothetical protein